MFFLDRRISDDYIIPDNFFCNDFEDIDEVIMEKSTNPERNEERHQSIESKGSCKNSNSRKTQISLLESGFSRNNSSTIKSHRSNDNFSGKPPLRRNNSKEINKTKQPKMTNFVSNMNFTEPDSTTTQLRPIEVEPPATAIATPDPSVGDLMVYVDVKIDGMVFRIPVLLSQVQTNTLGWLAEKAADKYAR